MRTAAATALQDSAGRFIPALIGVLVYLAILALAAMLLVNGSAERWRAERESRLTIQLSGAPPETRQAWIERALTAVRAIPEVDRAEPVPEARLAALLQPWLASALESPAALPAVIDVELTAEAAGRAESIRERLGAALPEAKINGGNVAHQAVLRLMRAIEALALLVVVVLGGTLAGAVVFAMRERLAGRRESIEILLLLGADEKDIVDAAVRRALSAAMVGGAIGVALGAATLLVFFWAATPAAAGRNADLSLSPWAWAALATLPLAAMAIAAIAARLTARRALAAIP